MDQSGPRVTVIIPTYNRGEMVKEAIESVLAQSYKNFELIVVDDGSEDHTAQVVRKYERARYIRLPANKGVSRSRNIGIKEASGHYIAFLDSDDLWRPEKLETQVVWMDANPDWQISYTDETWVRRGIPVNPAEKHQKYSGDIFANCLPLCIVSPSSVMMQAKLFEKVGLFDERMPACEDYDLWLRIASRYPIKFIPRKLIIKRGGHDDQLSQKFRGLDELRIYAMQKLLTDKSFDIEKRRLVMETILEKAAILQRGFEKNFKVKESDFYKQMIESYKAELRKASV